MWDPFTCLLGNSLCKLGGVERFQLSFMDVSNRKKLDHASLKIQQTGRIRCIEISALRHMISDAFSWLRLDFAIARRYTGYRL